MGARVLFDPAWMAGMIRRKMLDFIVKDFLNSEFKVAVLNLKLTKNELTVCKRRSDCFTECDHQSLYWFTQVHGPSMMILWMGLAGRLEVFFRRWRIGVKSNLLPHVVFDANLISILCRYDLILKL